MAFRNASKFRHTVGSITKREQWFPDLKPTTSSDYNSITASGAYLAFSTAATGAIGLLDLSAPGKRSGEIPLIHAHSADVTDMSFSPFSDHLLATTSDDTTVKLWEIPQNASANISSSKLSLSGHKRRVECLRFHHSVSNLLATGSGDKTVKIWDLEAGKEAISLDGLHDDIVHSISWSWGGDLLATSSKDGKIRIIDPRSKTVVQSGDGHKGVKASRIQWLGNTGRIATTGFSKTRERQFGIHDSTNLTKPIYFTTLDNSTGILDLIYDPDTQILVLAGKGDSSVKLYEINDSGLAKESFQELTTVTSTDPQKTVTSVPKRNLDLMNTEVLRLVRLTNNAAVPVTYTVPRKSKAEFQEDLYPPSPSTEPAQNIQEWIGGNTLPPVLVQLKPSSNPNAWWKEESKKEEKKEEVKPSAASPASSSPAVVRSAYNSNLGGASPKTSHLQSPSASSPSSTRGSFSLSGNSDDSNKVQIVRYSKYRHIGVKGTKPEACYTNLQTNLSAPHSSFLKANPKYFVVPWRGTGGQVGVIPFAKQGRQPDKVGCVECGSECLDFDFNPFNDDILATVNEAAHLQIWKIPEGGYKTVERTPNSVLKGHQRRVTSVDFHPLAENVAATSSSDFTVRLWDITQESEKSKVEDHEDAILSVGWNYDGSQMITSCKDKKLRIWDPRSGKLITKFEAHDGAKGFKSVWLGERQQILTVGHSKGSMRQVSLWDVKNTNTPLHTFDVDQGAGIMTPTFDPDTGVLYLSGKGDGNIKMFEINDESPFVHFLTEHRTSIPALGLAPLPKTMCDVKNCEIATFLKLSNDYVEQLHFSVPRTKMEFFQDDIFPLTRRTDKSVISADEWFSGKNNQPVKIDLKPAGMQPLSEAPKEQKVKKYDFAEERHKDDSQFSKEKLLDRFYKQTGNHGEKDDTVLKQDLMQGAADDEWDE